jgi:hypothetical protein
MANISIAPFKGNVEGCDNVRTLVELPVDSEPADTPVCLDVVVNATPSTYHCPIVLA